MIIYDSCRFTYNVDKGRAGDGCVYSGWRWGYAVWTLVSAHISLAPRVSDLTLFMSGTRMLGLSALEIEAGKNIRIYMHIYI